MIELTTDMLVAHKRHIEAAKNSLVIASPEPVDCSALLEMIEAAKQVYTENCPGP